MDLAEIFRTIGPTLVMLIPQVKKAARYMLVGRQAGQEYHRMFRELLAMTREDVGDMRLHLDEIQVLCERANINTELSGSLNNIDAKLDWYNAWKHQRVVRKIEDLEGDFRDSVSGIVSVIQCFSGMLVAPAPEDGVVYMGIRDYDESATINDLSEAEQHFQDLLANPEASIAEFLEYAQDLLRNCQAVLQEFTGGIDVGSPSRG